MRGNLNKMSDVKSELGVDLQMIDEEALNLAWRKYYSVFVMTPVWRLLSGNCLA